MHDDVSFCPDMVTRCPTRTTCCENLLSLTGYGCCMEPDAVRCPDSWHCCPRGAHCSPDCNFRSCKCVSPSSRPVLSKLQNEENEKEENKSKKKLTSQSEARTENDEVLKPVKPAKPVRPVKHVKPVQAAKSVKPVEPAKQVNDQKFVPKAGRKNKDVKSSEEHKRKDGHKTEKKKKQKSVKKMLGSKNRKKLGNGLKDEHHLQKKKKPKKHRKGKGREMDQKLKNLAKGKSSKKLLNKYVVKAHTTHHKTHYHPKLKQHWVTRFGDGFDITKKHKPSITFAHTWGKRKHQDLSFRKNGQKNKKLDKDMSLTEELTHLIVKHRRKKLRARLKVHMHTNAEIGRFEQKIKKKKVKAIHSAESGKLVKHRSSRKKKVLASKTAKEVEIFNQHKENPIRLEHENLLKVNEFNNLRQTSQEKVIANANSNHGNQRLHPLKSNENFTETSPQNGHSTKTSTNRPTKKLERKLNYSLSKNESTVRSRKQLHGATFKEMSSNVNEKEKSTSTNLVEKSPSPSFGFHEHDVSSAVDNVSQKAVNNTKSLFHVTGNPSRQLKSQSTYSGSNKTHLSRNQNRLQLSGNEEQDTTQNKEALGAKNFNGSIVNINDIGLTSGNDPSIDGFVSGSGFKGSGSGSASGLMKSFSLTGDYNESNKGEDTVEQMDNYNSTTDRVVSNSRFEADETSSVFTSGLESSSFRNNYHDLHIDKDGIKQMENGSGTNKVTSVTVFHSKESAFGSGSGVNAPQAISKDHRDLNNGKYFTTIDRVDGESGLEVNGEFPFIYGSGFEASSLPSDNYRDLKNGYDDGNDVAKHITNPIIDIGFSGSGFDSVGFEANESLTGNGFKLDESSIGSAGENLSEDDLSSDQLPKKLLLSNEENGSLTNHLKEVDATEELLPKGSLTNVAVGNGSFHGLYHEMDHTMDIPSQTLNVIKTSALTDSGSTIDDVPVDFGSGLQFGGEGDIDEESDAEDSNKDDIHSGLLSLSGKKLFNFTSKKEQKGQNVLHQYGKHVSEGSSNDISQVRFSHWNQDVQDDNSGFENGLYESDTQRRIQRTRREEYTSSDTISGQPPISLRGHTTNSPNFYSNRRSFDGKHVSKSVNVNLEIVPEIVLDIVPGWMTSNNMYHRKETRNTKSLRTEPTSKHKITENNHHISWKERELQQLMHWLSANDEKGGSRNYNKNI